MNNEEAIENTEVQDVSAEDLTPVEVVETEAEEVHLSPRDIKMREITERRNAEYGDNSGEAATFNEDLIGGVELPPQDDNSPFYNNDDGVLSVKIKVDGHESERTLEQIIATAQKHESADQKMQANHDRSIQLDARERQAKEYEQRLLDERKAVEQSKLEEVSQLSQQDADNTDRKVFLNEAAEGLFEGDASKFVDILDKALERPKEPILDVQAMKEQIKAETFKEFDLREQQRVANDAQALRNQSIQEGVRWLEETYPDVDDSRKLRDMVDAETEVLQRTNPELTPREIIKKATLSVVQRAGIPTQQPSSRQDNKSQMRQLPTRQRSSTHIQPKAEELDMTPQGIIRRQREAKMKMAGR